MRSEVGDPGGGDHEDEGVTEQVSVWHRAGRGEWSDAGWPEAGERPEGRLCRLAVAGPIGQVETRGRGPKAPSERGSDEGLVSMKTQRRGRCDRRGRRDNACETCVGVWGWGCAWECMWECVVWAPVLFCCCRFCGRRLRLGGLLRVLGHAEVTSLIEAKLKRWWNRHRRLGGGI